MYKENSFKKVLQIDIQIIRGLSVLFVLFYHFNFNFINLNFLKAGYLGVDIFFVVSGYVITKIINDNHDFNLLNFYKKRIKRLLPTLLLVVTTATIISIFIFKPFILKKNLESINSILFAASNIYFWLTSTLYGFAEKNNLLFLHTWSLSIELQFYLFYPLIFLIFNKNNVKYILLPLFILSYISVLYLYVDHPIFNFFSSLGRIFEITAGCLTFFYHQKIRLNIKKKFYSFLYFLGFSLIIFFMLFLSSESNNPNPLSLIYIIGTSMMLIFFNENLEFLYKLKLQYIGNISYSLYLWHFPILVFFNYYFLELNDFLKIIALIISIIISIISYYYIEDKFRKTDFKNNLIFIFVLVLYLILTSIYFKNKQYDLKLIQSDNSFLAEQSNKFLENKNKYSWRKSKNIFSFKNDYRNFSPMFTNEDNIKVLFIGDSFSKDIFNVFYTHKDFYKDYEFSRYGINLSDINTKRLRYLLESEVFQKAKIIYFSSRYKENEIHYLENWINLLEIQNKKIIIQLKKPEFKYSKDNKTIVDKFLETNNLNIYELNKYAYQNLDLANFIQINKKIKEKYDSKVVIFDFFDVVCSDLNKNCEMLNENNEKNYYDYGHFTLSGSRFFGKKIIKNKIYKNLF